MIAGFVCKIFEYPMDTIKVLQQTQPNITSSWDAVVKVQKHRGLMSLYQGLASPLVGSLGMVWCGVVWCGVVWCGVVWCGVVWCGVVWCGVVWCGVVWCGVVWCGLHLRTLGGACCDCLFSFP